MSTMLILRAESIRITGSLDEAADIAAEAHRRVARERHEVRIAHAAFQRALALLWAERLDECRQCLDDELRPAAGLAAARWVAWADFIEGGIALHDGESGEDPSGFPAALAALEGSMTATSAQATYFARGHPFTDDAVLVERAEYARIHVADLDLAARRFGRVARSRFPLQRALGLLGIGLVAMERDIDRAALNAARDLAEVIRARLIHQHATVALGLPGGSQPTEVFFC